MKTLPALSALVLAGLAASFAAHAQNLRMVVDVEIDDNNTKVVSGEVMVVCNVVTHLGFPVAGGYAKLKTANGKGAGTLTIPIRLDTGKSWKDVAAPRVVYICRLTGVHDGVPLKPGSVKDRSGGLPANLDTAVRVEKLVYRVQPPPPPPPPPPPKIGSNATFDVTIDVSGLAPEVTLVDAWCNVSPPNGGDRIGEARTRFPAKGGVAQGRMQILVPARGADLDSLKKGGLRYSCYLGEAWTSLSKPPVLPPIARLKEAAKATASGRIAADAAWPKPAAIPVALSYRQPPASAPPK